MALFDAGYTNRQSAVEVSARISDGWSRKSKSYGFSEQTALEFVDDYNLRVALTVLPRPSGFHDAARDFPVDQLAAGGTGGIRYRLGAGKLIATVQLFTNDRGYSRDLPWKITSNNKLGIYWVEYPIASQDGTCFELQLLIVFTPPAMAAPVVRDWDSVLPSAGLPSLGKRR